MLIVFMQSLRQAGISGALLLAMVVPTNAYGEPTTFRAVYNADYKGMPVSAQGIRELKLIEPNKYRLTSSAKSFFASIDEHSTFILDGEQVLPLDYQYNRRGIGKNKKVNLLFDWDAHTVFDKKSKSRMEVPTGVLDKLLYQYKMRDDLRIASQAGLAWPDMSYQIADQGKIKNYIFTVTGEEDIDTPIGKIKTVKATRVRKNSTRTTTFWLAPEYEFMLIRLLQEEKNGRGFELLLKEAEFGGKTVKGL